MNATTRPTFFQQAFADIESILPFNPAWKNNTGYFDHAVKGEHAPELGVGEYAKSEDEHGRKIVFVATRFGNCVLFERYSKADYECIVSNRPMEVTKLFLGSNIDTRLDANTQEMLIGQVPGSYAYPNIGRKIENLLKAAKELQDETVEL